MDRTKCPNFEACGGCKDPSLLTCSDCTFRCLVNKKKRILKFEDGHDCPVCLEENVRCVQNINCDHYICITCFKKCHHWDVPDDNQPPFPYSREIEDEYDEDPEKFRDDPIINVWQDCMATYFDEIDEKNDSRSNLRLCPVCRL
jgi:hypothetical protein